MKTLSTSWFVEGSLDLEYKQYILLAYLQDVDLSYRQNCLYPPLADLIAHYRTLSSFQEEKQRLADTFPHRIVGMNAEELRWVFERTEDDDTTLAELEAIVSFALPRISARMEQGRELYDTVDGRLGLLPVGVMPLYRNEGYVLLRRATLTEVPAYRFTISTFVPPSGDARERMIGIHLAPVTVFTYSLTMPYEQMKRELIRAQPDLPNPATYAVESELAVPLDATLLPIAKRRLLREVVRAA